MKTQSNPLLHHPLWPILMLVIGILMVLYQSIGFDFAYLPGDFGDGRLNNFILEHGYRYVTGAEKSFWSAPFMFPEKEVISYSDNLIGGLPFYVFFRTWLDRETAFQCYYLCMIALNFLGAFYALKKLDHSSYAASMGAFIYAFSLILLLQTSHIQLLARFVAPLSMVYFYLWLRDKEVKNFYLSSTFLVYQFYCAIYLGYFLLYALLFMAVAFVLVEKKWDWITTLFSKNNWYKTVFFGTICFVLLGILLYPYYQRSINGSYPAPEELKSMLPRIWSYFYCTWNSYLWGWSVALFKNSNFTNGLPIHEHAIFIGVLPFLFFVLSLIYFRNNKLVRIMALALLLFAVVTTSVFDVSFYAKLVKYIPGAQAIRSFARIMVVFMFFWCLLSAFFIDKFFAETTARKRLLLFLIPFLLFFDSIQKANSYTCKKADSQARCQNLVNKFNEAKAKKSSVIAFSYQFKTEDFTEIIHNHIDAMMVSQVVNLPTVNAYTARFPVPYYPYFFKPDSTTLTNWIDADYLKRINQTSLNKEQLLIID